jgi:hypothetical protein
MIHRIALTAVTSAAVIVGAVGCGGSVTSGPTTPTALPTAAAAAPTGYVLLDVQIGNGAVTPVNAPLHAGVGQPVVMRVNTDEYGELAVGDSPELRFQVDPRGKAPQIFQFTIDGPGTVQAVYSPQSGCPNNCSATHRELTVATIDVQPSNAAPAGPLPGGPPAHQPCELLNPTLARQFAGADAIRQPAPDTECVYRGSARTVSFAINPNSGDPSAPINHFGVLRPENQIPDLPYNAYWFAAGTSLVVVKDGLLLVFTLSDNPVFPTAQINQHRKTEDIALADQIVPRVR